MREGPRRLAPGGRFLLERVRANGEGSVGSGASIRGVLSLCTASAGVYPCPLVGAGTARESDYFGGSDLA